MVKQYKLKIIQTIEERMCLEDSNPYGTIQFKLRLALANLLCCSNHCLPRIIAFRAI